MALSITALSCTTAQGLMRRIGGRGPSEGGNAQVASEADADATRDSPGAPASEPTPLGPTPTPTLDPAGSNSRATGSGTVTVDGEEYAFEVYLCGWEKRTDDTGMDGEKIYVAEESGGPNEVPAFIVKGASTLANGSHLFVNLEVTTLTGILEGFELSVFTYDPANPGDSWHYETSLPIRLDLLEFDGAHASTTEPIPVTPPTSAIQAVPATLDVSCDSYGGSSTESNDLASQVAGLPTPPPEKAEVTVDGEPASLEVDRNNCGFSSPSIAGFGGSLTVNGGFASINVDQSGDRQDVSLSLLEEGGIWTALSRGGGLFEVRFVENRIVAEQPITVTEINSGETRTVQFDVVCP